MPGEVDALYTEEARSGLHPNPPPPPPRPLTKRERQDRLYLLIGVSSTAAAVASLLGAIALLSGGADPPVPFESGRVPIVGQIGQEWRSPAPRQRVVPTDPPAIDLEPPWCALD